MNLLLSDFVPLIDGQLPNALFVTVSGAHLYGFPSVDSDVDLRGAFLTPLDRIAGLIAGAETVERKLDQDGREIELVAHDARKYLNLLRKHNGYILEQVFSPLVVCGSDFLDTLRPLATRCVTRGCYFHYRGFLKSQLKLLEREPVKKAKTLLYAYRVLLSGIHLLRTGAVQANLPELNRELGLPYVNELIARKAAKEWRDLSELDWTWHQKELARLEAELERAHSESRLPDDAPHADVHESLVRLRFTRFRDQGASH